MLFAPSEKQPERTPPIPREIGRGEDLVEDPYCHTYVPVSVAYRAHINGKIVYFCSQGCFENYRSQKAKDITKE